MHYMAVGCRYFRPTAHPNAIRMHHYCRDKNKVNVWTRNNDILHPAAPCPMPLYGSGVLLFAAPLPAPMPPRWIATIEVRIILYEYWTMISYIQLPHCHLVWGLLWRWKQGEWIPKNDILHPAAPCPMPLYGSGVLLFAAPLPAPMPPRWIATIEVRIILYEYWTMISYIQLPHCHLVWGLL